jgi:hypothetical protein
MNVSMLCDKSRVGMPFVVLIGVCEMQAEMKLFD